MRGKMMDIVFDLLVRRDGDGWTRYDDIYDDVCAMADACIEMWLGLDIAQRDGDEVRVARAVRERYAG
eukprot:UN5097